MEAGREAMEVVHVRDDDDLDRCGSGACSEGWLDSEYVIEVEPVGSGVGPEQIIWYAALIIRV